MGFAFEERASDSPLVETVYRTETASVESFVSVATAQWALVVTSGAHRSPHDAEGSRELATRSDCPPESEFIGIVFRPHAWLTNLPAGRFVDSNLDLPSGSSGTFWLDGSHWQLPSFENADTFVAALERAGALNSDPVIDAALRDVPVSLTSRSVQRRFRALSGLSQNRIRQISKAQQAARLLEQGTSISAVAHETGYADQAHLTKAVRRLLGQTPAQIAKSPEATSLY